MVSTVTDKGQSCSKGDPGPPWDGPGSKLENSSSMARTLAGAASDAWLCGL